MRCREAARQGGGNAHRQMQVAAYQPVPAGNGNEHGLNGAEAPLLGMPPGDYLSGIRHYVQVRRTPRAPTLATACAARGR